MLLAYAKRYLKLIIGQLFFATVWVASQLAIPRLMVDIIDYGILLKDLNQIMNRGLLMLLATGVNIVSLLISIYFLQTTAGISKDLRGICLKESSIVRRPGEVFQFYFNYEQ